MENYSDISNRVMNVKQDLEKIQQELDKNPSDGNLQRKEKELCIIYTDLMKMEESEARQKSRVQWLDLGDKNSSFFFKCINNNRNRERIHNILLPSG